MSEKLANGHAAPSLDVPYSDLSYDPTNPEQSTLNLVLWIRPKWRDCADELQITKFTEGITNTLFCVWRTSNRQSQCKIDKDAVLMRAYGNRTDLIIDRDREAKSHSLLASKGLAPPLLGRFKNGLLYNFIPGTVCKAEDLPRRPIWRGVARRVAEWHAIVPISSISTSEQLSENHTDTTITTSQSSVSHRQPTPNLWSVMQKWIDALDDASEEQRSQKTMLQKELNRSFEELDNKSSIGEHGFVFAHCDLLCANVIQLDQDAASGHNGDVPIDITFIDYEYATPAPAAFDIANHFAEFVGYDCDYSLIPGKSIRRDFIEEYIETYGRLSGRTLDSQAAATLFQEVDRFRGIPGLYWGIWSLIQARISQIDFDYTQYAKERLGEYFAWRAEHDGNNSTVNKTPLREKMWAEA